MSLVSLDAAGRVAQPDEDIPQGVGNAVERHLPVAAPCQVVAIDGHVRLSDEGAGLEHGLENQHRAAELAFRLPAEPSPRADDDLAESLGYGTYTKSLKARIMSLTMGIRAYAKTLGD